MNTNWHNSTTMTAQATAMRAQSSCLRTALPTDAGLYAGVVTDTSVVSISVQKNFKDHHFGGSDG